MSDQENDRNKRPLSEISHLFLSGIREQAGENRTRPVRTPPATIRPATPDVAPPVMRSVEAKVGDEITIGDAPDASRRKRVTAVVGATVTGESLGDAALAYAASLAASDQRIGVMTVDANLFRLQCVSCDADGDDASADVESLDRLDLREASAAVLEMNHDVDRWLLVVGDPRRAEARSILRQSDDWTMLCTCDHDGIVSGYRTLKGLAEGEKSPLAIAVVDAPDDMQARKVFEKLAGVCRQFLDWDVEHEMLEADVEHARVRTILRATPTGRMTAQWAAVEHLLALEPDRAADEAHYGSIAGSIDASIDEEMPTPASFAIPRMAQPIHVDLPPKAIEPPSKPIEPPAIAEKTPMPVAAAPAPAFTPTPMTIVPASIAAPVALPPVAVAGDEVIDLPDGTSVMQAVLRAGTQLLATPIAPPMCADATVTVGRDRTLTLVAHAQPGLAGVDAIASAVRWLDESRQLIAMAMPQLAIDAATPTRVLLLVDQADRAAIAMRPLFAGSDGRVTVRSYRRLRWGGRTGLLLDAA